MQFVEVCVDGESVSFVNLHLSNRQAYAEKQLEEVLQSVGARSMFIGGDFNLYNMAPIEELRGDYVLSYDLGGPYVTNTDKTDGSRHALDHILAPKGYEMSSVEVIDQSISDHSPLLVVIETQYTTLLSSIVVE